MRFARAGANSIHTGKACRFFGLLWDNIAAHWEKDSMSSQTLHNLFRTQNPVHCVGLICKCSLKIVWKTWCCEKPQAAEDLSGNCLTDTAAARDSIFFRNIQKRRTKSWVFPKNRGKTTKMDGDNNGKPYFLMDDLGGKPTIFGNTKSWRFCHEISVSPYSLCRFKGCPFGVLSLDQGTFWRSCVEVGHKVDNIRVKNGHRHDEYPSIFLGTNISSYHIISHQKDDFPVCKVGCVSSAEQFFPLRSAIT